MALMGHIDASTAIDEMIIIIANAFKIKHMFIFFVIHTVFVYAPLADRAISLLN